VGRPFTRELSELEQTYAWAVRYDVQPLRQVLRSARGPLLTIGSGGSFTAATYAAFLHEAMQGEIARAATPLCTVDVAAKLRTFHMLLISSGGRNRDGLQACEALLRAEPVSATVLTASRASPLSALAHSYSANLFECQLPVPKDGFLATNSLLAFCTIIGRAHLTAEADQMPTSLAELVGADTLDDFGARLKQEAAPLLKRDVFLVLHGPSSRAAALDIESKFSEAALGSVHVSDYRNFGHGRHHWLAKRARQSAVIALVHDDERSLALRTLAPLPRTVPRLCIPLSGSVQCTMLAALLAGYYVAAAVGRHRKLDPGRPGVPAFGSRLYSLQMPQPAARSPLEAAAHRKQCSGKEAGVEPQWRAAAQQAAAVIGDARFTSIAIDYDGTLCGPEERFGRPREDVTSELVRLAQAGIHFGIATGRGRSVRDALREAIPAKLWKQFTIGYYNGGFVAGMREEIPPSVLAPGKELRSVLRALKDEPQLEETAEIQARNPQITIECRGRQDADCLWELVQRCLARHGNRGLTLVRSSHSIDVLAPTVTKLAVVNALPGPVLRIGDRGRFPGNDFALLDDPLGLSVDEVSFSAVNCWNLLTPGLRGVVGTLEYLRAIRRDGKAFRIAIVSEPS